MRPGAWKHGDPPLRDVGAASSPGRLARRQWQPQGASSRTAWHSPCGELTAPSGLRGRAPRLGVPSTGSSDPSLALRTTHRAPSTGGCFRLPPGQAPSMTSAPVPEARFPETRPAFPQGTRPPFLPASRRPHSEREWEMSDQHLGSDQMEFSVCDGSDVSTWSGEARCSGLYPDRRPVLAAGPTKHQGLKGTCGGHSAWPCVHRGAAAHTPAWPSAGSTAPDGSIPRTAPAAPATERTCPRGRPAPRPHSPVPESPKGPTPFRNTKEPELGV